MIRSLMFAAATAAALGTASAPVRAAAADVAGKHVNLKGGGVALHGYDAVAYFDRKTAVKGLPAEVVTYQGVRYQFADAASKAKFAAAPERYVPAYGGFCAYGVARGFKVDIDPEAWSVVNNKLYLNVSKDIRTKWQKDTPRYIGKADSNWETVKNKKSGVLGGLFS